MSTDNTKSCEEDKDAQDFFNEAVSVFKESVECGALTRRLCHMVIDGDGNHPADKNPSNAADDAEAQKSYPNDPEMLRQFLYNNIQFVGVTDLNARPDK